MTRLKTACCLWAISVMTLCIRPMTESVEIPVETLSESPAKIEIIKSRAMEQTSPDMPCPVTTTPWADAEIDMLAKLLWGEARGVDSDTEKAAVIWCVLNRVDAGYGDIAEVVTAPNQFVGYRQNNQSCPEMITLCIDVMTRWYAEKDGQADVGRVLPQEYLYFSGDGVRNHFRNTYTGGTVWDWSLPSPYEN